MLWQQRRLRQGKSGHSKYTQPSVRQKTIPIRDRKVAYASELDDRHQCRSGDRIYPLDRQAERCAYF
jgi:hypothetical protein